MLDPEDERVFILRTEAIAEGQVPRLVGSRRPVAPFARVSSSMKTPQNCKPMEPTIP